jgi:arylamine N-acetyltransferase
MNIADSPEIPHSRSALPLFSSIQLNAYFSRIELPSRHLSSPILADATLARSIDHGLPFLAALMRHHMATIPFENLSMHYSSHEEVTLDPLEIYDFIVERSRGRGGHCMQMNRLFSTVLRSLGFDVTTVAGRVNTACQAIAANPNYQGPSYNGW